MTQWWLALWPRSKKDPGSTPGSGRGLYNEFACSPCVLMGFFFR